MEHNFSPERIHGLENETHNAEHELNSVKEAEVGVIEEVSRTDFSQAQILDESKIQNYTIHQDEHSGYVSTELQESADNQNNEAQIITAANDLIQAAKNDSTDTTLHDMAQLLSNN